MQYFIFEEIIIAIRSISLSINSNKKPISGEVLANGVFLRIIEYLEGRSKVKLPRDDSRYSHISSNHSAAEDSDMISMGSSPSKVSANSKQLSVLGHGSQKSGARGSNSPSSRHRKKRAEVPRQKQSHKVLYARSSFNSRPNDDLNVMTIFSVKGVDRGVNTDPLPGVAEISTFLADENEQNSSLLELSVISFPDSAPPKAKGTTAVKESTFAHFPELGVPSSPYAHRSTEPVADSYTVTELRSSPNALVTLYNIYWQHIPSVFRARLLTTASSRSEFISSRDSLTFLFEPIEKEIEKLDVCIASAIKGIEYCLRLTQSLIVVGEEQRLSDKYKDSLGQLFR